ncbi:NUDIX hydrolase [Agromyces aureus]|uniref:DNA mismatch repair protein MutT n=1 Tax=Agromyces aureus TaxID=453304 RepID=A0A191WDW7_9MICO|nr:NUDIX hydrolase [Agromyces aureus]ANJ26364.1 DNA mismatch repair protein MutT [Agromyces aureus]
MSPETAVYAAGAVCWRIIDGRMHVLLIHRTVHGDVTIPKGKVDPGESLSQTAVREIQEETGLEIALGVPLGVSRYLMPSGREKVVHYWAGEVSDHALQHSTFKPNGEVAALEWVTIKRARNYLTYAPDVEILENFAALVEQGVTSTFALLLVRHGKALARGSWKGQDTARPLAARGVAQAADLADTLSAWRPERIYSSPAIRCVTTVRPLSAATSMKVRLKPGISEDAWAAGDADIRRVIGKRIRAGRSAVLCSHGPVLPEIIREISLATATPLGSYVADAAELEPGGFSVVHVSKTNSGSGVIAIETHAPRV